MERPCWPLWCCWRLPLMSVFSGREAMLSYLSKTISTLCRDIAAMHDYSDPVCEAASYDDVPEFVVEQMRNTPVFLTPPILLPTPVVGVSRLFLEGSMFHNRPLDQRCFQVESWRRSR